MEAAPGFYLDGMIDSSSRVPEAVQEGKVSRRELVGRRDVLAHALLTIDDERVYRDTERDFRLHYSSCCRGCISCPSKRTLTVRKGFDLLLKTDATAPARTVHGRFYA